MKRKILFLIGFLFFIIIYCIIYAEIANNDINHIIKDFTSRGELVYETYDTQFYKVKPQYDYEDLSNPVLREYDSTYIGTTGDIFITDRNPQDNFFLTGYLSNRVWIGHSALVIDDNGSKTAEIVGNLNWESNVVQTFTNWWSIEIDTPRLLLLRPKNITVEQKNIIKESVNEKLGLHYNYTFLFQGPNTYYCSDFVSRVMKEANIDLNKDRLFTLGEDFIRSKDLYIAYYKEEYYEDDIVKQRVYFLSED